MKQMIRFILTLALTAGTAAAQDFDTDTSGAVSADGTISIPDADFRSTWPVLGSWTVLEGEAAAGMHVVYTQPGVIEAYNKTGAFPDGAVLIKELSTAQTAEMTTGTIARADARQGWFVMVKDSKGRFSDSPLWGDGWGWAYFSADNPDQTGTEDYQAECISCHVPAQETDWIYIEGYPALNRN